MRKVPSCSMREGGGRNVRNIGFLEQDRSNIFVPGGIEQGRAVGPPGTHVDRPNFELVGLVLGHGPGRARMLGLPNSDPSSRVNTAFGLRRADPQIQEKRLGLGRNPHQAEWLRQTGRSGDPSTFSWEPAPILLGEGREMVM